MVPHHNNTCKPRSGVERSTDTRTVGSYLGVHMCSQVETATVLARVVMVRVQPGAGTWTKYQDYGCGAQGYVVAPAYRPCWMFACLRWTAVY